MNITGGRPSANRPPVTVLCPPAPTGATWPHILGHLHHYLRLQRPQELRMVMCEMSLDRVEQLLVGATCESRPALAVDDTSLLVDRVHFV